MEMVCTCQNAGAAVVRAANTQPLLAVSSKQQPLLLTVSSKQQHIVPPVASQYY
jgi:hypothetical protein